MTDSFGENPRRVLFIVENLPSPFDRRIWQEATTLRDAGYEVTIICPTGKGYEKKIELIDRIRIYRHSLPIEASNAIGYAVEYSWALVCEFYLAWKVLFKHGFDVIHAANPPDTIFLIALFFRLLGKRFVFDHHDINPELYEAKFGRRDLFYRLMLFLERCTFNVAKISIATNESYRQIAIERGGMKADSVFVVRSGPMMERFVRGPAVESLRRGRKYLVGYVGVIGEQEGLHYLLQAARHVVYELNRSDIHFGIVGDGTSLNDLKTLAIDLGVDSYITFTGRVSDKEMLDMLNTADLCVNPDIANDMNDLSTMNKIMEYMALAKPVVQFDLKEGRVSAKDASLYAKRNDPIDMAEKIVWLIDHPEERQKMGEYGYNRVVNELEWKYEAPKLLAAYDVLFFEPSKAEI